MNLNAILAIEIDKNIRQLQVRDFQPSQLQGQRNIPVSQTVGSDATPCQIRLKWLFLSLFQGGKK
ncbi:hypothetical protein D3OALGA1CA_4586 [Olavius algarvensis associated proteobacterium Delta 3]|nr:hypothetical protein D3OALGB2SA_4219 [Olavius algarvensis associated proteobacterium Delta 3]CAB5153767.1 hypothetical protein D3OALGA1CA_4586 [Olavius algarvensis associated proteobacterium Delta 3]